MNNVTYLYQALYLAYAAYCSAVDKLSRDNAIVNPPAPTYFYGGGYAPPVPPDEMPDLAADADIVAATKAAYNKACDALAVACQGAKAK